jgi:hypothetical protein
MKKTTLITLSAVLFLIWSCTKDTTTASTVDCSTVSAKFAADVSPIMKGSKCTNSNCHPTNGDLSSYTAVKGHYDAGHLKSKVIDNRTMPPAGSPQLTTDEYNKVKCWVSGGGLNN